MKSREEVAERILSRADSDEAFRRHLVDSPRAAIGEELGTELPEDLKITVIEEGEGEVCLVLPAKLAPAELSEEELEGHPGARATYLPQPTPAPEHGRTPARYPRIDNRRG